jgi:NAD(P)-dependent dehydrogenase (short-subunit alcohol dehydrogenase family)
MEAVIATRTFTMSDQERFAELSGDWNPMHMSVGAARRTVAGAPVVHGIHALLWALDGLAAAEPLSKVATIGVGFDRFLYLDQAVELRIADRTALLLKLELIQGGRIASTVRLQFGERNAGAVRLAPDKGTCLKGDRTPETLSLDQMSRAGGSIDGPIADWSGQFKALVAELGSIRVEGLARTSMVVGMLCPGLHSVFSELAVSLSRDPAKAGMLDWEVLNVDERFNLVKLRASFSGLIADISAFVRPEPVRQPAIAALSGIVPEEFAQMTALIVGGSRGLGEATGKIIARGGGKVVLTFKNGSDDAARLAAEICSACGPSAATTLSYDVSADPGAQLGELPANLTHVYYFATPRIFQPSTAEFSRARFNEFLDCYGPGFERLCRFLVKRYGRGKLEVFYPSSVAVTDRPKGMTEYAMAKAAGEILALDLARSLGFRLKTVRLDRTLTDQTATLNHVPAEDATQAMLRVIREQTAP